MKDLPPSDGSNGVTFTVADFYEAGREPLGLELVAGGGSLARLIGEPIVNRAGLALTGFHDHFAWMRPQLVGHAETAYLRSLPDEVRLARLGALMDLKAACFIYTNGSRPKDDEIALAERHGAVLLASPLQTWVFVAQSSFVLGRLGAPRTSLYGTTVEVNGIGVMIEGDPGLGKSETALGLVKRGSALIADDLTCIRREPGSKILYASASDSTAGFMEIRGIGIMNIASIFGINAVRSEKRLQLVITFRRLQDVKGDVDRVGQMRRTKTILGVEIPNVILPVSEGRDLVNLVETATQQFKLLQAGYDPVEELAERLRRRADGRRGKANGCDAPKRPSPVVSKRKKAGGKGHGGR